MRLTLIRHPPVINPRRVCYGRTNLPLASGWQEIVRTWPISGRVYASPLTRCHEAARFAVDPAIPIIVDQRLMEIDFGAWENTPWDALPREELDEWAREPVNFRPGRGESVAMLQQRIGDFWKDICDDAKDLTVVTHGGPIKILISLAEGREWRITDSTLLPGCVTTFKITAPT